jgi:hypothetical protein
MSAPRIHGAVETIHIGGIPPRMRSRSRAYHMGSVAGRIPTPGVPLRVYAAARPFLSLVTGERRGTSGIEHWLRNHAYTVYAFPAPYAGGIKKPAAS